jgi:hypothetical protein
LEAAFFSVFTGEILVASALFCHGCGTIPSHDQCKPVDLFSQLLREETAKWEARVVRFEGMNQPLHMLTDRDLIGSHVQQATAFGSFFHAPEDPKIRETALVFLRERSALLLSILRQHIRVLTRCSNAELDSTLLGMLARHELIAEGTKSATDWIIDLPGRSIQTLAVTLGTPIRILLANLSANTLDDREKSPKLSLELRLERKFLATDRGRKSLELFTRFSDPTPKLSAAFVRQLCEEVGVSKTTFYRFRDALIQAGAPGIVFADLVPYLVGSLPRGPKRQVEPKIATLIEVWAKKAYFVPLGKPDRARSVNDLYEMVRKDCLSKGLSPPAYTTVQRFVKQISARDPILAMQLREGREAAQKLEPRQGHLSVQRYGELLGIDCTPCDVMATPEGLELHEARAGRGKGQRRKNAKRGNFVTVTDTATSQVLRSTLFAGSVSAEQILEVLHDVFLGDTSDLSDAGVTTLPQALGLPMRIRMDSGSEFVNRQVKRVIGRLGIEPLSRNKWSRHHGGTEERTIKTLSHAHHVLPGTTMNNISNRAGYDSALGAVITIESINRYHQQFVERHNNLCAPLQELSRHQHAQDLLERGVTCWRTASPSQLEYLRTRMYPQELRVPKRTGVELHGLKYTSPRLGPLIIKKVEVEITYSADNIRMATVIDPGTGELIEVVARLPEGFDEGPISLAIWNLYKGRTRKANRIALDRVKTPQQIAAEVMAELKLSESSTKLPSKGSTKLRANIGRGHDSNEIEKSQATIKAAKVVFKKNPPMVN